MEIEMKLHGILNFFNALQIQNLKDFFREELRKIHQAKNDDFLYFKSQVESHILLATF